MDSRVAQLQHVIILKDQMILELQTQLAAYESHFGALDASTLKAPHGEQISVNSKDVVAQDVINTAGAVSAHTDEPTPPQQQKPSTGSAPLASPSIPSPPSTTLPTGDSTRSVSTDSFAEGAAITHYHTDDDDSDDSDDDATTIDNNTNDPPTIDLQQQQQQQEEQPPPRRRASITANTTTNSNVSTGTGKNVVLDFVEDSPMFRRQLESFEESLSGLRGLLKEILAHTKEYVASGVRYGNDERALADELVHRKYARALFTTSCPELGSLSTLFTTVHDTIAQLQRSRTSMLMHIESLLTHALAQFTEHELKEATDLRKDVARLADEYESLLSKLLAKPKAAVSFNTNQAQAAALSMALAAADPTHVLGSVAATAAATALTPSSGASNNNNNNVVGSPAAAVVPTSLSSNDVFSSGGGSSSTSNPTTTTTAARSGAVRAALERDVGTARLKFELARFDLVRYLNRLDCQKKFVLIECFDALLHAFSSHFDTSCTLLQRVIEPSVRERDALLQRSKRDFDDDDVMWRTQRQALEARLRADVVDTTGATDPGTPLAAALVALAPPPPPLSTTLSRSFELPIEVISNDTFNSRASLSSSNGIVKQGYLFQRNSMFPARSWKRRWFQIHSGKLYQNKGKHMDLTLVCDLMLSRVREAVASNLPFCFEIIDSSQAKFLLQATSERDVLDWVDAARRSTESMLEKQAHRQSVHPEQQRVMDELIDRNSVCADCNATPAEWVSINIGCFLCIECSGIHRSLGVHVSKVRSLTLDSWDMALLLLLRDHLGNDVVNAIYEHSLDATSSAAWRKPTTGAITGAATTTPTTHDEKRQWIKAKYDFRGFVERSDVLPHALVDRFVHGAAASSVQELVWCLAHGVDVNACNAQHETALFAAARVGSSACCDFLLLNGASLVLADATGKLPLDAAVAGGFDDVQRSLRQKMRVEQTE